MTYFVTRLLVTALAVLFIASGAIAGTKGRIIPNGSVSFQKNGTTVNFTEQTILDENALISCTDSCLVKLQGLTLKVADQTKFAVKEINNSINLYVETGQVIFTLTNTSQQMAFYTSNGQYVKTEGFMVPASTSGTVTGYMRVADTKALIGMDKGSMVLNTADGVQTVNSGSALQLALAEVPDNNKDDDDDDKAGLILPGDGGASVEAAGAGGGAGSGGAGAGGVGGGTGGIFSFTRAELASFAGAGVVVGGTLVDEYFIEDDQPDNITSAGPASPNN